jgi:hypothetical protein
LIALAEAVVAAAFVVVVVVVSDDVPTKAISHPYHNAINVLHLVTVCDTIFQH